MAPSWAPQKQRNVNSQPAMIFSFALAFDGFTRKHKSRSSESEILTRRGLFTRPSGLHWNFTTSSSSAHSILFSNTSTARASRFWRNPLRASASAALYGASLQYVASRGRAGGRARVKLGKAISWPRCQWGTVAADSLARSKRAAPNGSPMHHGRAQGGGYSQASGFARESRESSMWWSASTGRITIITIITITTTTTIITITIALYPR